MQDLLTAKQFVLVLSLCQYRHDLYIMPSSFIDADHDCPDNDQRNNCFQWLAHYIKVVDVCDDSLYERDSNTRIILSMKDDSGWSVIAPLNHCVLTYFYKWLMISKSYWVKVKDIFIVSILYK